MLCVVWLMLDMLLHDHRFFKQLLAFIGVHQMALSLFRFIASAGRTMVVSNVLGSFVLLLVFVLGGFIVSKGPKQIIVLFNDEYNCFQILH